MFMEVSRVLQTSMQEKDNIVHSDDKHNNLYVLICKREDLFLAY